MLENFIYAKQKSLFEEKLNNGEVLDEAIVFIEDTKEIWNHGTYFDGSTFDPSNIKASIQNIIDTTLTKTEAANIYQPIGDYVLKSDADLKYATINKTNELSDTIETVNTTLTATLNTKQDIISDLSEIREGASLGATALQKIPEGYITETILNSKGYATSEELTNGLNTKQEIITDLQTIRENATLGATALQSIPSEYITETELVAKDYATIEIVTNGLADKQNTISDLVIIREGAALGATAIQEHQSLSHLATNIALNSLDDRVKTVETTYVNNTVFSNKTSTIEESVNNLHTTVDSMQDLNAVLLTVDSTNDTRAIKDLYDKETSSRVYPKTHSTAVVVNEGTLSDYVVSNNQKVEALENVIKTDGNGSLYLSNDGTYKDLELNKYLTITSAQSTYATIGNLDNYATATDLSSLETIVTEIKNDYVTKNEKSTITQEIEKVKTDYVSNNSFNTALSSYTTTTDLTNSLNTKVDKVAGKDLSTNDFTNAFKTKLEGLSNYNDADIKNSINTLSQNVANAISNTAYLEGVSKVTSVANIPITYRLVIAAISASASLTFADVPSSGKEIHVIIHNTANSEIAITLPNSGNYVNTLDSVMSIDANSYGEINFISDGDIIYIKYI